MPFVPINAKQDAGLPKYDVVRGYGLTHETQNMLLLNPTCAG
jgi:hypothetical protein